MQILKFRTAAVPSAAKAATSFEPGRVTASALAASAAGIASARVRATRPLDHIPPPRGTRQMKPSARFLKSAFAMLAASIMWVNGDFGFRQG